jgi:ribosomal protein S18 acetylase RimI-like enzyme
LTPTIRPAREDELTYVLSTWSRSAYELTRDRPALYSLFRPLFEQRQAKMLKAATVLVAVNPEDDEQVFGACVYERGTAPVLHFVCTKRDFQRMGIARALLKAAGITIDAPAVHSLPFPMPLIRSGSRSTLVARKAWTYVPYGLMP